MLDSRGLKKKRVAILGSTGSIGVSTLEVLSLHPERFEVFALTASTQVDKLLQQCVQFRPAFAVMASPAHGQELARLCRDLGLPTQVLCGPDAITEVASHEQVDVVMAAIVGAAGLASCLGAARAGKRLLLANKEALVVGGDYFLQAVNAGGAKLLPIDSEHSAVFQSLPEDAASWATQIDKIILTASGGPFRRRDPASFADITPDQACAHPNWVMGRKISVDSATMMNKALEVIEARYLFGVAPAQIEVVIHPQSVIHSMVQYRDNSVIAQLGTPDMKVPIAYGLSWPQRMSSGASALDFRTMADMTFESLDDHGHRQRFPGLALAWSVLAAPAGSTAVLNAANEIAVAAFLAGQIRFDQMHAVNLETLAKVQPTPPGSLEDLLALDAQSRELATRVVTRLSI
ncbi:1-deoxy-D-xylulose-5-phosphate reductoisomerase [Rhodoferax sp.]|jgi:1-deoxy-D-xylulose-5-phosphate reductoisomerase|uniref:1-deoxy-D-xylulose-5-phosphate reductoisomerase n=1 Tax=Rhodoferax sp. TaxID=50421 RepID=UPI0027264262|nr:1-deoxy-D-xylulose-5-phosphate reductoisomerase [Rhodoferax sp.]MDO9143632.1 1-deoxy-D-xylulose-5-phosphate reductoisomerase [Rhodoferax sp.]MDP1529492.1 1-deoxy-D-xylulose-5-phosphate reductoisomerase [Rhodoferax sp.]MDP1943921.1 1-deoxy-D-xylulose-5-phosphate reductoisomerase [Rhodoferax sp.]MDP2441720.1 1-deoxy-D-xylulose-5-phosphate reductoisomerase [Rhodoferax sp.]MDP3865159.1 1-deoxy-D-xylulose-5-phosphate reductoisomerase [Rhodoferax sp.]